MFSSAALEGGQSTLARAIVTVSAVSKVPFYLGALDSGFIYLRVGERESSERKRRKKDEKEKRREFHFGMDID